MKLLSPYVLAKRNLAMTILFMSVMTFLATYVETLHQKSERTKGR